MSGIVVSTQRGGVEAACHMRGTRRVVFLNGTFDLCHVGHVRLFKWASEFADLTVVAVNTDEYLRRTRGPMRPLNRLMDRMELIAAFQVVSLVFPLEDDDPSAVITRIRPEFVAKGPDYATMADFPEKRPTESYGGKVIYAPWAKVLSTSRIVQDLAVESRAS